MGCRIQLCPVSAWPKAWREGWRGKGRGCQKSWGAADFWRKVSGRLSHWPQEPPDHPSNGCSTGRCLRKTWPEFSRLSRVSQSAAGGPQRPSPPLHSLPAPSLTRGSAPVSGGLRCRGVVRVPIRGSWRPRKRPAPAAGYREPEGRGRGPATPSSAAARMGPRAARTGLWVGRRATLQRLASTCRGQRQWAGEGAVPSPGREPRCLV